MDATYDANNTYQYLGDGTDKTDTIYNAFLDSNYHQNSVLHLPQSIIQITSPQESISASKDVESEELLILLTSWNLKHLLEHLIGKQNATLSHYLRKLKVSDSP